MCFGQEVEEQSESGDDVIKAIIEVEQDENLLRFLPKVQNQSLLYFEYHYLLLVRITDQNDELSIQQKNGRFTLMPEEIKSLSAIEYPQSPDVRKIKTNLFIRDEEENRLITKDSVEIIYPSSKRQQKVDERSLILSGIVVDETKTKLGSDFYSDFYSIYNQLPNKFNFIVSISELPYRGPTSIIQIKADQDLVYEFFTNPNEEYIEQQARHTIRVLAQYAKSKENIKYEFNY